MNTLIIREHTFHTVSNKRILRIPLVDTLNLSAQTCRLLTRIRFNIKHHAGPDPPRPPPLYRKNAYLHTRIYFSSIFKVRETLYPNIS